MLADARADTYAIELVELLDTPVLAGWDRSFGDFLEDRFARLSSGEQHVVNLACSITGRIPFDEAQTGTYSHTSLHESLTGLDPDLRRQVSYVLHRWLAELAS